MSDPLEDLRRRMEAAAAAENFEEARRLRDQLSVLRQQQNPDASAPIDTSRLTRQQPGAMGLGTSDSLPKRPAGWVPPKKPDPMTKGHKPAKHRRR